MTNLIGNGVATVVVGKWCHAVDGERLQAHLDGAITIEAESPEALLRDAVGPHGPPGGS